MLSLDKFYGQEHILEIIKPLIEKDGLYSAIFYGPAGCGKTTLANIIAREANIECDFFNAAINKKSDLVKIIETAKHYDKYLIIIDEIHRLNKDKQDILLPYLESSNIIVLGLTTNNPYHSINPAIRSRMFIFEFNKLESKHIEQGINNFITENNLTIDKEVVESIIISSNGDMRYTLRQLEILKLLINDNRIDINTYLKLSPKMSAYLDKNSDYYYDLLSAFQKSIRGSDVDASLLYLANLLQLGDLDIICRRLLAIGYEDIGLANPELAARVVNATTAAKELGFPEARLPLSTIVIELALSPKSNTAYEAIKNATTDLSNLDIPTNIKHHGTGYLYPHAYNGWVKQQYMPTNKEGRKYISFKSNSHENKLKNVYDIINKNKSSK